MVLFQQSNFPYPVLGTVPRAFTLSYIPSLLLIFYFETESIQVGLKLVIFLPQLPTCLNPPEYWDYRHLPPIKHSLHKQVLRQMTCELQFASPDPVQKQFRNFVFGLLLFLKKCHFITQTLRRVSIKDSLWLNRKREKKHRGQRGNLAFPFVIPIFPFLKLCKKTI